MSIRILSGALLLALAGTHSAAAHAEVVVIMSAKSDVSSLSKAQAAQIYLAKSLALPTGGSATPIDQDDAAAVRNEFYTKVAAKDSAQMRAYWSQLTFTGKAQRPKKISGDAAVVKAVAANPTAIGYVDASSVDGSVKVVLKP